MQPVHPARPEKKQPWPLQMGQPLTEAKYSQQQSKCNGRHMGSEPKTPVSEQMH